MFVDIHLVYLPMLRIVEKSLLYSLYIYIYQLVEKIEFAREAGF